jgi:hypothetical protein
MYCSGVPARKPLPQSFAAGIVVCIADKPLSGKRTRLLPARAEKSLGSHGWFIFGF